MLVMVSQMRRYMQIVVNESLLVEFKGRVDGTARLYIQSSYRFNADQISSAKEDTPMRRMQAEAVAEVYPRLACIIDDTKVTTMRPWLAAGR